MLYICVRTQCSRNWSSSCQLNLNSVLVTTNYSSEVAILTKVTRVTVDPINFCMYAAEYNSQITQVRLRVTLLKSWDFVYLPERSVSLFDIYEI